MRLYEQAVRLAHENDFVHNEGIANEVAARFYLNRGFNAIGDNYLRNARYCYLRWGARGKVKQLERLYPVLVDEAPHGPTATTNASIERLDLRTVVKALQAVSREIDLGKLIEILMRLAVQHAGAERGLLFLSRGKEHGIEAEAMTSEGGVRVILRQAFATLPKFPESILRYVIRARESVLLNDASTENPFLDDEYVCAKRLRSILCLPLVKLGDPIGVLYLENNLTSRAFTPEQFAVLELLASQAAISLENARLYAELQHENSDRRKAESALRTSEGRWRNVFENSSAGIALLDPDGRFIAANMALQKILGYSEEELQKLTPLELTYEEDRTSTEARIAEFTEGQRREHRVEKRCLHKDGRLIWIDLSTVFIPAAGSTPAFFSAVIVDITERKQAEAKARKHREELAYLSRVAIMGEMAGALAHELNQPLTGIVTTLAPPGVSSRKGVVTCRNSMACSKPSSRTGSGRVKSFGGFAAWCTKVRRSAVP